MTRRSQLWEELEEGVPGLGEGRCQDPEARKISVCLRNKKKASVVEMGVCVYWGRGIRRCQDPGQSWCCGPR